MHCFINKRSEITVFSDGYFILDSCLRDLYSIPNPIYTTSIASFTYYLIAQMLMGSTCGMALCLALVAAGSAGKIEYNNNAAATVSIVFIFAFGAVFSGGRFVLALLLPCLANRQKRSLLCSRYIPPRLFQIE